MEDAAKTKKRLVEEMAALRRRVEEMESAQAALRRETEECRLLHGMLDSVPVLLSIKDTEMRFVLGNLAMARSVGLESPDGLVGKTAFDFYPPEVAEAQTAAEQEILRTGQPLVNAERCSLDQAGNVRWDLINTLPLRNHAGEIVGLVSSTRNVTQRKQLEIQRNAMLAALRKTQDFLTSLLEYAPMSIYVTTTEGELRLVNRAWEEFEKLRREETVGRMVKDIFPAEVADQYLETNRRVVEMAAPAVTEEVGNTQDGRHYFHTIKFPLYDATGQIEAIGGVSVDITERKRAEEEVRRQAKTLAALHETTLELAVQPSLSDLLHAIVARAAKLLKAQEGGFYFYRPDSDDLLVVVAYNTKSDPHGIVLRRGEGLAGKVLETGQPLAVDNYSQWEGQAAQHAGAEFEAYVAVPVRWGDRLLGIIDVGDAVPRVFSADDIALLEQFTPLAAAAIENHRLVHDVQEQMEKLKRAELQLIQSAKLAAVGELAAGVAHEINNPLTSVMGFAELLLNNPTLDASTRQDLETIVREAMRARDIVRNLLSFSRQTKPQRQPTDIGQVVRQTVAMVRQQMERGGVVIEEDYAADVGLVTVDGAQLKQVFLNLIANAAQAMPRGGKLKLHVARRGDEVAISVSDTGIGILPEMLNHIFEPFFTTRPVGQGTGLGLPMSLGIVQEHGGRISVESQVGQGSTFTVWLPAES
jgi:PAS domain S-box-containing protein